jgi:hypothetical protein
VENPQAPKASRTVAVSSSPATGRGPARWSTLSSAWTFGLVSPIFRPTGRAPAASRRSTSWPCTA